MRGDEVFDALFIRDNNYQILDRFCGFLLVFAKRLLCNMLIINLMHINYCGV